MSMWGCVSRHQVSVPRHRLSTYDRRAFSVPGPRLSGTHCLKTFGIRNVVLTLTDLTDSCSIFFYSHTTSVSSVAVSYENTLCKLTFDTSVVWCEGTCHSWWAAVSSLRLTTQSSESTLTSQTLSSTVKSRSWSSSLGNWRELTAATLSAGLILVCLCDVNKTFSQHQDFSCITKRFNVLMSLTE